MQEWMRVLVKTCPSEALDVIAGLAASGGPPKKTVQWWCEGPETC